MRRFCFFVIALAALAQEPGPAFRADINMVPVTFSATDGKGAPIRDLRRSELKLTDDQRPREVTFFGQESGLPLTVGLVVDMSASQARFYERHREDMRRFVGDVLKPGDRAFLMSFGNKNEIRLVTDLTGSAEELGRGVESLDRCHACRSPIWTALFTAARSKMKNVAGRKALVLLSDGEDTGGPNTLTDAIEAAQDADAPVYAMVFNPFGGRVTLLAPVAPVAIVASKVAAVRMRRLAEETGGRYYDASRKDTAAGIFAQIEEDLRSLYVLGFSVPESERDGRFHELKIETTRPGARIRARKGYNAGQ